jgi:hypothetical protein
VAPETRGLIDARRLALMKPGALLINVAPRIVDDDALYAALKDGQQHESGRAKAALERTRLDEGFLHRVQRVAIGKALDGDELGADVFLSPPAPVLRRFLLPGSLKERDTWSNCPAHRENR